MSSTYEEEGPKPWFRVEMSIFYIVFFVVFPFFFVNIFVALIIVTFNELGEAELQDDMDKNQKSCIDFAIQAKPLELYVPEEQSGIRYHIWRLVTSAPFENFILLLIVCNTILLMLKVSFLMVGAFRSVMGYHQDHFVQKIQFLISLLNAFDYFPVILAFRQRKLTLKLA